MRTSNFRLPLALLGATVAVAVLAGCSDEADGAAHASSGGGAGTPKVSSVPKLTSVTDKSLPIDAYLMSDDQLDKMQKAEFTLRERCMERFGIAYRVPAAEQAFRPKSRTQFRYGVTDADAVATHGYKPAGSEKTAQRTKPQELSRTANMVLTGTDDPNVKPGSTAAKGGQDYQGKKVPAGGCIGEARAKLGASGAQSYGGDVTANKVNTDSWAKSYDDERVRAAFAKWSSCMKKQGYVYADPMKAGDDPAWQKATVATAKERRVASADVDCKVKYNVVGTWYTVEVAYQNQMIEQDAQALAEAKKAKEKQLKLMAEVS
ncbi:hypothetical protein [Streptomyces sp. NPDC102360]|uniref:hypothetical protein n=1 Tax=Streptomyces sp. NPDC102360 TaxID=3366160 RepID=UPI00380A67FE